MSESNDWFDKGEYYYKKLDFKSASRCFEKAVDLNPNNGYYWGILGITYFWLKKFNKALDCLDKATIIIENK